MPRFTDSLTFGGSGELVGVIAATQMPSIKAKLVNFKAAASNTGKVYIGGSGVTKAAGATSTTTGWELSAGEETGFVPCGNLNNFYRIADAATDDLVYLYFK